MKKRILAVFSLILISSFQSLLAQDYQIDYYGVSSENLDSNMLSVTSDLYYTQLCEINDFLVTDKRYTNINYNNLERDVLDDGKTSFFAVISQKKDSDKWISTLFIINKDAGTELSVSKEYDSYYKILMESKASLKQSFISLIQNKTETQSSAPDFPQQSSIAFQSTEDLAGTWQGEDNIDKVVIMRGGRGFVIYKNGATMNINISITNSKINIAQVGKSNPSFFPDLPRAIAAKAALSNHLIKWELNMTANDTLSGTRTILVEKNGELKDDLISVNWYRKS